MARPQGPIPVLTEKHPQNPRRVPAINSVSLRRSSSKSPQASSSKVDHAEERSVANLSFVSNVAAASDDVQDVTQKAKKEGDAGNAEEWFDDSNKNPQGRGNVRFVDYDLPFYLPQNRSSNETDTNQNSGSKSNPSPENQPALSGDQYVSNESWSDDYRSIIDDLTVENKELKQKLKKYEQLYSSHLQDNKLFEVFIHQLAPAKKRKLEAMLREFAAGVEPTDTAYAQLTAPNLSQHPNATVLKRAASSHSTGKPQDSGYASLSVSGGGAASIQSHNNREMIRPVQPSQTTDQRVRSYVQDLPPRLLPRGALLMSDKTKKKMVVQKLEQLFVGKTDTSTKQSQSVQQQEISQSAANADRKDREAKGRRIHNEGFREAKISNESRKKRGLIHSDTQVSGGSSGASSTSGSGNSAVSGVTQRPTRPLDLDPGRAQDPKETILYMKHLGFDSPTVGAERSPEQGKGWVYLNLLMNMAQLHVFNVTPAFVRDSIAEYSNHFELSEDGRSVRWKGVLTPSIFKMDSSYNNEDSMDASPEHTKRGADGAYLKSTKVSAPAPKSHVPLTKSGSRTLKPNGLTSLGGGWRADGEKTEDSRYYSPMFFHGNDSDSYNDLSSSIPLNDSGEKSRTISSDSNVQSGQKSTRKSPTAPQETGTMIFYTGGKFYTDLSGDPFCMPSTISYERLSQRVMGDTSPLPVSTPGETKGPLSSLSTPSDYGFSGEAADVADLTGLEPLNCSGMEELEEEDLIDVFQATGIGGVTPQDNFLVDVAIKHQGNKTSLAATRQIDLRPTILPPPSYAFLQQSSSESDCEESDDEDEDSASLDMERSGVDENGYVPPTFLNVYSSESIRQISTGDTGEDSSIDMLEYARRADPENIAAREKEFDDAESTEQVGPAPPGSIAATVGDMSNFLTSQEDVASVDGRVLRMHQGRRKERAGMKRSGDELASPSKRKEM